MYDRTAIARKGVSAPMREIVASLPALKGKSILHYGEGRAFEDTALLSSIGTCIPYEPNSPDEFVSDRFILNDYYSVGISVYVFNTLPPVVRRAAWKQFMDCVGIAIWAVRADKVYGTPSEDGVVTKAGTFQKSYDVESAMAEWPDATIFQYNSSFITLWQES
jgi:hypothetical protein